MLVQIVSGVRDKRKPQQIALPVITPHSEKIQPIAIFLKYSIALTEMVDKLLKKGLLLFKDN